MTDSVQSCGDYRPPHQSFEPAQSEFEPKGEVTISEACYIFDGLMALTGKDEGITMVTAVVDDCSFSSFT